MSNHAFPAAIEIADARLYAGMPLTEDLMMDFRDRDQDAADRGLEDRQYCTMPVQYYTVAAGAFGEAWTASRQVGSASPENVLELVLLQYIYVPEGVSEIEVAVRAAASAAGSGTCVRMTIGGNAPAADWSTMGAALEWKGDRTITITTGAGWKELKIFGVNKNTGSAKTLYCSGFRYRML